MARKRLELRPNKATGNYERLLGWKRDREDDNPRQHKFYLGKDKTAATIANQRLEKLWAIVEKEAGDGLALWNSLTLEIGKTVAKGGTEFEVMRPMYMPPHNYVAEVQQIARRFPIIACVPADADYFAEGVRFWRPLSSDSMVGAKTTIHREAENLKLLNAPLPASGDTLHEALDEYSEAHPASCAIAPDRRRSANNQSLWSRADQEHCPLEGKDTLTVRSPRST